MYESFITWDTTKRILKWNGSEKPTSRSFRGDVFRETNVTQFFLFYVFFVFLVKQSQVALKKNCIQKNRFGRIDPERVHNEICSCLYPPV